ncbi:uncharacterized protein LOC114185876 [Vigna unguiculata]|uniref:Uncharacterized protein n=1 Tax=Vigna unguiculata TaxID=3917 RepID=A0A4D6NGW0_VIGUN|nr:uncharacterized protein LOC114185876 [Vigna unguiculata]QCE12916.1 hypothetical protein DEO72_LG10g4167 [Vigna unguiculata]
METDSLLPKPTYGGIKRYFRRRRYQRLDSGGAATFTGERKTKMIRLRRSPHRQWRMKAVPKLTWMVRSPLKMFAKLKNAYMKFMLKSMNTDNMFGNKNTLKIDRQTSKVRKNDAFEARLIFEISKALVASHELYPMK